MPEDFDPYYLWLGIPPHERPANHYRLLGVTLFEENPGVIESAADRQMAHLRSVAAGKHSALSQRLLNEVAAAKVCLLRIPQKAKYDQALHAKLDSLASQSSPAAQIRPAAAEPTPSAPIQAQPLARAQAIPASAPPANDSENFLEDLTASIVAKAPAKSSQPHPPVAAAAPTRAKKLLPVFVVVGACLLVGVVVIAIKAMSGQPEVATNHEATVPTETVKPKESLLVFDWPADARSGMTLTVDGVKVVAPPVGAWEFKCSAGKHHVVAKRSGFKPIDKVVEAPVDGNRKVTEPWQPLATLALDWPINQRDGAVLSVDGQMLNVDNEQPLVVPVEPGPHMVRITRAGFSPFEKETVVAADQHQDVSIALLPTAATLIVRWPVNERAGAVLRIDGALRPIPTESRDDKVAFSLAPGRHTVSIMRPGFKPFAQAVTLDAAIQKMIAPFWMAQQKPPAETVVQTPDPQPSVASKTDTAPVKHPIPSSTEQQRVAKQLDQIYKSSHDATKDLAQAKELCGLALKADDLSERYMLLVKGADLAAEAGDFSLALQAVDALDAEFAIVALDVKEKLLEKFVKVAASADQITDSASTAERLVEDAMAADRYDLASMIATLTSKLLVKKSVDPDVRRDTEKALGGYRAQIKALQPQWDLAQKAKQALETNADDADANGVLGRWYCFYKGNWKDGLPLLAKSSNERLKPIAQQDVKSPPDATQKVQVADQWWDIAQKETAAVADAIHLHAGDLYRSALPDLNSVLKKAAVEKRLTEVAEIRSRIGEASGQHAGPVVFQRGRWVDVLKLIDFSRDIVAGSWTRNGSEINCAPANGGLPRLRLPIVLDGGYDLEVDFTRTNGACFVHTVFFLGRQPCGVMLNAGSYSGLDSVNGRTYTDYYQNPFAQTYARLQNGHKYQEVIAVRAGKGGVASIDISIDGKQFLSHWEGDPASVAVESRYHPDPKQPVIEIGYGGSVTFHAVRLRMVSGQGHVEALAADETDGGGNTPTPKKGPIVSTPKLKIAP